MAKCINDTNGDGDCQACCHCGGCEAIGGPFTRKRKLFRRLLLRPLIWYRDLRVKSLVRRGLKYYSDTEVQRRQRFVNWANPNEIISPSNL